MNDASDLRAALCLRDNLRRALVKRDMASESRGNIV